MSNQTPDVSGFTRSEKFIMESLASLQDSVVELRDRTSRCETRLESIEAEYTNDLREHQAIMERAKGQNQIRVALIGGIFTLLSALAALILTLIK